MKHLLPLLLTFSLTACAVRDTPSVKVPAAALPPAARPGQQDLFLPDDLEVTLWAESPMLYNPTNMDVDARGRLWVTEAVNYRDFNNKPDSRLHHPEGDRVMILEDTNGDGIADASKVFVQDKDLVSPLGIAVLGNKVFVSCAPNLIVYTDEDGDDKPDKKEVFLTGFGGFDHDHSLHALLAGPDGRLYFNTGNAGPHVVTDKAGWTLRSGSLYTGGSPYNTKNQGNMQSDDGRTWVGGLALRIGPDGKGLEVLSHNFRNAYELTVDSYGNLWQNDNDDQVITCRTTWLMEGGNAGFFSTDGTRYWQADKRPGQDTFTAHWHQDDPGVIPAGDNTGAGSPTGITINESDLLGEKYRGLLLSAEAGRNVIFGYLPQPQGAGFSLDRTNFISSLQESTEDYKWNDKTNDPRKWFRPSDVAIGTDGAIYIADWYDPIVGGHQMHDSVGYGRIYRITPKGRPLTSPKLDLATTAGQVQALLSPAVNVRYSGYEALRAQGAAAVPAVRALLQDQNPYHRARAVWLLAQLGPQGQQEVEKLLSDANPEIRLTAFRALRQVQPDVLAQAAKLASDPSPAVRREVAVALRDVPIEKSRPLLLQLAEGYDGRDRWYLEAWGIGMEGKEAALYPELLARLGSQPESWDARFAGLAWRLHPPAAVGALKTRAGSPVVPEEERQRALVALGFIPNKTAAQAMQELTESKLADVAEQATWWLQYRGTNDWRPFLAEKKAVAAKKADSRPRMLQLQQKVLQGTAPKKDQITAARQMAQDPIGGELLLALAEGGKLTADLRQAVAETIRANPDQTVRVRATEHFGPAGGEAAAYSIPSIAKLPADQKKGQVLFASQCGTCHRLGKTGADIGPDLTLIRKKFDRSTLLDAIINPSAAIAFGYEPWLITGKDGSTTYGFLLADGTTLVVKDPSGQRHVLEAAQVASRKQFNTSLMPTPAALGLNEQDLADVTEYLMTLTETGKDER